MYRAPDVIRDILEFCHDVIFWKTGAKVGASGEGVVNMTICAYTHTRTHAHLHAHTHKNPKQSLAGYRSHQNGTTTRYGPVEQINPWCTVSKPQS